MALLAGRGKGFDTDAFGVNPLRGAVPFCCIWNAFGRFMVTVPQGLSEGHTFQARPADGLIGDEPIPSNPSNSQFCMGCMGYLPDFHR